MSIDNRVQQPIPILPRDIAHEPGEPLAVEDDLFRQSTLDQIVGVDAIAIELESGVIQDEIDATAGLSAQRGDGFPELFEIVSEDVLFSGGEMFTTGGLEISDVFLGHVNEEGEIGGVAPTSKLSKEQLVRQVGMERDEGTYPE